MLEEVIVVLLAHGLEGTIPGSPPSSQSAKRRREDRAASRASVNSLRSAGGRSFASVIRLSRKSPSMDRAR